MPERLEVPGFVEHSRGPLRCVADAWLTWVWTVSPGRFWKRVPISAPVRPWRWLVWLLVLFGLTRAGSIALYTLAALAAYNKQPTSLPRLGDFLANHVAFVAFRNGLVDVMVYRNSWRGTAFWNVSLNWASYPSYLMYLPLLAAVPLFTLLLLPEVRRVAKVRVVHVLRAFFFSLGWLAVPFILDLLNSIRVLLRAQNGTLILDDWMPAVRSDPSWPVVVMSNAGGLTKFLTLALITWLTLWWWNALKTWQLARAKPVFGSLLLIWALSITIVVAPALMQWMV